MQNEGSFDRYKLWWTEWRWSEYKDAWENGDGPNLEDKFYEHINSLSNIELVKVLNEW